MRHVGSIARFARCPIATLRSAQRRMQKVLYAGMNPNHLSQQHASARLLPSFPDHPAGSTTGLFFRRWHPVSRIGTINPQRRRIRDPPPPVFVVAMTGRPHAIACACTKARPSSIEAITKPIPGCNTGTTPGPGITHRNGGTGLRGASAAPAASGNAAPMSQTSTSVSEKRGCLQQIMNSLPHADLPT